MVDVYNKNGELIEEGIRKALFLEEQEKQVICMIGGGGKSTMVEALAKDYAKEEAVICTTTTKIMAPRYGSLLLEEDMEQLEELIKRGNSIVTIARQWNERKLTGVSETFLKHVMEQYPILLIEADGSKGLPSKVPNETEPVIPKETTMVLGIQGIDAYHRPIKEVCHRPELVAALLKKKEDEPLTAEDMAELFLNPKALRKHCEGKAYWAVIQKVDTEKRMEWAKEISSCLQKRGFDRILITKRQEENAVLDRKDDFK